MTAVIEEKRRDIDFDIEDVVENIIRVYPTKVAKKRRKHIVVRDPSEPQEIEANVRTVPGIITQRGCCFAGCKGVVIGPIVDMIHIVHGPIGCSYYSWMTRRNQGVPREDGHYYLEYCFSTDMQEDNIIFGGEKKLRAAIREAYEIFKPKAISIHATCPVGLIGDDIHTVAKEMSKELGIDIVAFSCEGYRGVSQSAGHHIANNGLFEHIVGKDDIELDGYTVNCLGEYNIGGDAWEIERILDRCGIKVASTFSGNGSYTEYRRAHMANVNLVQCHRSINYMAEMMETKFGIPWIKVNFIGVKATSKSLRKLAAFFEDDALTEQIEKVIEEEERAAEEAIAPYRERLEGKTAFLFVGGSRAHHYQDLFRDLGMKTIVAGYEFAHRDDYEGRDVLPYIKVDADSRNIPELDVEPDPERFKPRKDPEKLKKLKEMGIVDTYEGMMKDMGSGTLVVDDISHFELEYLMKELKPDIVCSGIKDKYVIQKMGVPSKQLHNYDYSGPFAGYKGAVNFAKEIDMLINNPSWSFAKAPWEASPLIKGALIIE
ncbi:Nitrogenase (molybdenum-iron) alpha chain [Dissulfuribacter thermophilus]|uniref:Nitrogenase protein alpha chain n=1 Tax=Dissulfuribacter thermophilus TaxID=1156395 RepID=A0A1B9F4P8_9BACT|nr:nitrogenase molybdenum-iron protein alpha chain [Dissulfuribacter thermophilus]OCC14795.1 Nitrogenase (molybdenum-iron) alpha chain [Dissulfuribacter thermophilus]